MNMKKSKAHVDDHFIDILTSIEKLYNEIQQKEQFELDRIENLEKVITDLSVSIEKKAIKNINLLQKPLTFSISPYSRHRPKKKSSSSSLIFVKFIQREKTLDHHQMKIDTFDQTIDYFNEEIRIIRSQIDKTISIISHIDNKVNKIDNTLETHTIRLRKDIRDRQIADNDHPQRREKHISESDIKKRRFIDKRIQKEIGKLTRNNIISYVYDKYKIRIPKIMEKEFMVRYVSDIIIKEKGFDLYGLPTLIEDIKDPIQIMQVLKDRHKFPNRKSLIILGNKIGVDIDDNRPKKEILDTIYNSQTSSLQQWYRVIRKTGGG